MSSSCIGLGNSSMALTFCPLLHTIQHMREWSLTQDDPLSLKIAADARLSVPDYGNDQIWELRLTGGEPPALSLQTSYGLRAKGMRVFVGFVWEGQRVLDPERFASPPEVRQFYPNYLKVAFQPFSDLAGGAEYWVQDSYTLAGRVTVRNLASSPKVIRLRLYALLLPGENPRALSETRFEGVTVLAGRTGNLEPVIFLSGGAFAEEATYPALAVEYTLPPHGEKHIVWGHAGLEDQQRSFEAASAIGGRQWEAEIARLDMVNSSLVDIQTGDPEWDVGFALSQRVALSSFVGPTVYLPHPSIVESRIPDRGYSARGDGKDYTLYWSGQTAADAFLALPQVILAAPDLARGLLKNFFAVQTAEGFIDWKPGLGGQRNGALVMPLLAAMCLSYYQHTEDLTFLEETFPRLLELLELWFSKDHDRDQDGFPEWKHTIQAGFDDWPSFVRWRAWGQGLDISKAETADLASYLYRDCLSVIRIARLVGKPEAVAMWEQRAKGLREAVEASWSDETSSYHHRDRDLHISPAGELLGKGRGAFTVEVNRDFDPPVRVLVRSRGVEGGAQAAKVLIHGKGQRGRHRVERLSGRKFQWFWEFGTATSEKASKAIERVEVQGLAETFETEIWVADYTREDQTLLLPLWAGIPNAERAQQLVRRTVTNPKRYWRSHGVPNCSAQDPAYSPDVDGGAGMVEMFWNTLIGDGLVEYGYLEQAADLVHRLMTAVIGSLRKDKAFRAAYHPDQEGGLGERGNLAGLAPLSLFLHTLGVQFVSPHRVHLRGRNVFPWPVVLRWRGLEVRREADTTVVTFPNGQQVEVEGEQPQVVEQEANGQRSRGGYPA